jgi:SOS-response transcriptional repressor LexA
MIVVMQRLHFYGCHYALLDRYWFIGTKRDPMPELDKDIDTLPHYNAFMMQGDDMVPAVKNGDYVVADLSQRFIRSGDIYVVNYKNSIIVCRLLLDNTEVSLIFDATNNRFIEHINSIKIIGRVIEIKTLKEKS